jgi:hypothetical protein
MNRSCEKSMRYVVLEEESGCDRSEAEEGRRSGDEDGRVDDGSPNGFGSGDAK